MYHGLSKKEVEDKRSLEESQLQQRSQQSGKQLQSSSQMDELEKVAEVVEGASGTSPDLEKAPSSAADFLGNKSFS